MRVLIAADETRRIFDMVEWVKRITRDARAEVIVLHILHPGEGGSTPAEQETLVRQRTEAAQACLDMSELAGEVIVQTRAPLVRVYQQILVAAQERDVDMIVVASKRAGSVIDIVLGGVAQELLRRSPIPVLVVRPEE